MNTGQMLLVVGAITLLSTLGLAINSSIVQAYDASYDNEAMIDAVSIGQAMIDDDPRLVPVRVPRRVLHAPPRTASLILSAWIGHRTSQITLLDGHHRSPGPSPLFSYNVQPNA